MFKITAITLISYAVVYRCMVTDSTSTHLIQLKRIRMTAIERNTTSSHDLYEYMFNKLASNFLLEDHSNKHYYILNEIACCFSLVLVPDFSLHHISAFVRRAFAVNSKASNLEHQPGYP